MDSGRGEWGKKIEDDINEIVKTVKNKHPIRPDNSCIIGASYGGYSALISSIRFPRQYRCAVSYFGVTDIPLILSSGNVLKNESVRDSILHVVGDPKMEGIDHVAVSPVYLVDKLDVPVLLMAGWRDRIADAEHSHRLHYMMKKHGKNSQFILYRHASHGHESWFGDMHQNITIDAFLRHYLDVPLPEDEEEKKVLREEWYVAGTLLGKKNRIADRNEEMSLLLLRQAAKAGHERAQQELEKNNLGSR
jgi:dipeptidyl aminopeptidase/acylaminoacyl peptidase